MPYNTEQRPVTKTVTKTPMTNPGENLKVKLGNAGKYEYLRVFFGGPEGETPFELVLHRPIGITPLDNDEWVVSDPGDYALLLVRESNPDEEVLRVKRDLHKKELAVTDGLISIDSDNVVTYPVTGHVRNEFLEPFKKKVKETIKVAKKAANDWKTADKATRPKVSPGKPNFQLELVKELRLDLGNPDAVAELAFSAFMAKDQTVKLAEKKFPDSYETLSGVYADTKQDPIPWAKGKGKGQIQQHFAKEIANALFSGGDETVTTTEPLAKEKLSYAKVAETKK